MYIGSDPDDFGGLRVHATNPKALADRVLTAGIRRPEPVCQGFINNGHRLSILRIFFAKIPASAQWNRERAKVFRRDGHGCRDQAFINFSGGFPASCTGFPNNRSWEGM